MTGTDDLVQRIPQPKQIEISTAAGRVERMLDPGTPTAARTQHVDPAVVGLRAVCAGVVGNPLLQNILALQRAIVLSGETSVARDPGMPLAWWVQAREASSPVVT